MTVHSPVRAETSSVSEIWYTRCPVPTTSGIAHHNNWVQDAFARQNIPVRSVIDSTDPATRQSHFTHSLPASFREGGNIPAIWAKARGQDTVVAGITWVDEQQLILVRPTSAIRSLSDLKGKRLGIPRNTSQVVDFPRAQDQHGLVTALRLGGLAPDEATFVDIAGHDFGQREPDGSRPKRRDVTADALLTGEVDAIYAKGAPGAALAAEKGLRVLLDINAHLDPYVRVNTGTPRPVTVNRDLAENHPEIVARYLAVLIKTAHWAKSNADAVVRVVASETGKPEDSVRRGYGPDLHRHFDVTLSEQYVEGLRRQKDFLLTWGYLDGDFDYDAWIVREPLRLAGEIVAREGLEIG